MDKKTISAVILSAGSSSRMGCTKALLDMGGQPALSLLVCTIREAGITDITVVTGHNSDELRPVLERLTVCQAVNPAPENGMFSSILAGLKNIGNDTGPVLLFPADIPAVSADTISEVLRRSEPGCFAVPTFMEKKGHPLLIPQEAFGHIAAAGEESTMRKAIESWKQKTGRGICRIPVEDEGCVLDMDTKESYQKVLDYMKEGGVKEPLRDLFQFKSVFLVRHGQTVRHEGPIFTGNYDVPLDETGIRQAKTLAKHLKDGLPSDHSRVFLCSGDLSRSKDTAVIIGEALGIDNHEIPELNDISLGSWAGVPIRKIREEQPEKYAERGKDLLSFKIDEEAETFYDVQYRVMAAVSSWPIEEYDCFVIVSHDAVLHVLESNYMGRTLCAEWSHIPVGGVRLLEMGSVKYSIPGRKKV